MVKKSRGGQTINSSRKRRESYLRRKKIGAVLIEFAFSIPIFLVLIYYIHDLPKYKLMQRKMQFVSNIMAATIQNIANQKKGTDNPKITQTDLKNAMRLAFLAVYPGLTQYGTGGKRKEEFYMPLGYFPHTFVYYVRGTGANTGECKWLTCTYAGNPSLGADYAAKSGTQKNNHVGSMVTYRSGAAALIWPDLTISNGEAKIIMECALIYPWNGGRYFSDGRKCSSVPISKTFGFLFLNPVGKSPNQQNIFHGITIFIPDTNAFDANTAPE